MYREIKNLWAVEDWTQNTDIFMLELINESIPWEEFLGEQE